MLVSFSGKLLELLELFFDNVVEDVGCVRPPEAQAEPQVMQQAKVISCLTNNYNKLAQCRTRSSIQISFRWDASTGMFSMLNCWNILRLWKFSGLTSFLLFLRLSKLISNWKSMNPWYSVFKNSGNSTVSGSSWCECSVHTLYIPACNGENLLFEQPSSVDDTQSLFCVLWWT